MVPVPWEGRSVAFAKRQPRIFKFRASGKHPRRKNCLFSIIGSLSESATTSVLTWNAKAISLQRSSVQSSMAFSESMSNVNLSFSSPLYATFSTGVWHGLSSVLVVTVTFARPGPCGPDPSQLETYRRVRVRLGVGRGD